MASAHVLCIALTVGAMSTSITAQTVDSSPPPAPPPDQQPTSGDETLKLILKELRALRQRIETLESQHDADQSRIRELEGRLATPAEGVASAVDSGWPASSGFTPTPQAQPATPSGGSRIPPRAQLNLGSVIFGQGNQLNPSITVFGDLGGRLSSSGDNGRNRFNFREAEIDFRAPITPFADGVLIVAIEEEIENIDGGNEINVDRVFDIEEGYINFHTLPFDTALKLGKFRNAFGRNNQLHTHDLPQIDRPLAIRAFLGPEGLATTGGAVSWLVPNPFNQFIEVSAEIVNSDGGDESPILGGANADNPAVVGHIKWFTDIGVASSLELGGSYLFGATSERGNSNSNLFGFDATYMWRDPERPDTRSFLLQGELLYGEADVENEEQGAFRNESLGAYIFGQYQFAQNWYAGIRFDYTEFINDEHRGPDDEDWAVSPYITWYLTEFLRLRLEYQQRRTKTDGDYETEADLLFGLTFSIGAHAPHPYWVNR